MDECPPIFAGAVENGELFGDCLQLIPAHSEQAPQAFLANGEFLGWLEVAAMRRILEPTVLGNRARVFFDFRNAVHSHKIAI